MPCCHPKHHAVTPSSTPSPPHYPTSLCHVHPPTLIDHLHPTSMHPSSPSTSLHTPSLARPATSHEPATPRRSPCPWSWSPYPRPLPTAPSRL
eukprot:3772634-Rhodomonas_salina.1